jgi:methionyl-tRNA formyltransferase
METAAKNIAADCEYVDLVISYLFWKKIKEPFITTPKFGCINFHPALLPEWKGLAGYNVAILYKLKEWGVSAHYVDQGIDTGKIIRVYKFSFDYRYETAKSLEGKTQQIQCDLYKSVLTDIINGTIDNNNLLPNVGDTYISKKNALYDAD